MGENKSDLYMGGYGRQWGEKITYSMGATYGLGLMCGGTYGCLMGLRQGGRTPKLMVNSVLNGAASRGPWMANQGAVMTLFYVAGNQLLGWVRGEDDWINASAAGGFSGLLYKSQSGTNWVPALKYAAAGSIVFTGIDQAVRKGML